MAEVPPVPPPIVRFPGLRLSPPVRLRTPELIERRFQSGKMSDPAERVPPLRLIPLAMFQALSPPVTVITHR